MNNYENHSIEIKANKDINILIICNKKCSSTLNSFIQELDYSIIEVNNINQVFEKSVDLIIFDITDDYLKSLVEIQANNIKNVPVVIAAEQYNQKIIQEAYSLKIIDFLHKPYIKEEVQYKIQNILEKEMSKDELEFNTALMREYKMAIDRSTIVSKADTKGIITYVNPAFSKISGYTVDEMIGEPHNIVRHPDMSEEVFEELWKTISAKKTWHGVLKNRKKDGSHYWVNTVINPIVDNRGNIIEYISIRSDITQLEDLKEKLSSELNVTSSNFKEAYQLALEYEKAIDESNILSRTNLKGQIIYANKEFERVSGYTKAELYGKSHRMLRHPDTSSEVIKDMWKTITGGKIWKGLIKNKSKNGEPYWVNSVILPIINASGEITEYMSIRNDVTEIIHLHEEIENTQKELIYRMGELAESRSKETGNHIKRVAFYSKILAQAYGLSEKEVELLFMASPMHDIGKLSTPDSVLKKEGKLTKEEWSIMQEHAHVGYNLLHSSDKPILKAASILAHEHHEKWDGSGYPQGLKGEEIHIYGRITALADVFDALGSDRCYKKAWDDDKIFALFKEEKGKHFEPKLIDLFFENLEKILSIRDSFRD